MYKCVKSTIIKDNTLNGGWGMEIYWGVVMFLFGITLGSFYNVVGLRVPKKIPFSNDRSYCPTCEHQLSWSELIPVLSFVLQSGKCRHCKTKISFIYPVIELATGLLFLFSYIQLGFSLELITALIFMSMLMIIFVSDLHYMFIPNKILWFFLPLLVIMRVLVPLDPWYNSIIGAVVGYGLLALIIILSNGGMGAGDMKLFGVLGIVLGLGNTLLTFFLASLFGAVIGIILKMRQKIGKGQPIPFGPYIVVAAIIAYFYVDKIIDFYLSFLS